MVDAKVCGEVGERAAQMDALSADEMDVVEVAWRAEMKVAWRAGEKVYAEVALWVEKKAA